MPAFEAFYCSSLNWLKSVHRSMHQVYLALCSGLRSKAVCLAMHVPHGPASWPVGLLWVKRSSLRKPCLGPTRWTVLVSNIQEWRRQAAHGRTFIDVEEEVKSTLHTGVHGQTKRSRRETCRSRRRSKGCAGCCSPSKTNKYVKLH